MKNTNPIFSLKNFRSFGEDGADFELAPITVLTGCNSAGKSSLVKALLLLSRQKAPSIQTNFKWKTAIPNEELTVSAKELALGKYERVLNVLSKNGLIELSYTVWSNLLHQEVRVRRVFKSRDMDKLNNGTLHTYSIEKLDGTTIYESHCDAWEERINESGKYQKYHIDGFMDPKRCIDGIRTEYDASLKNHNNYYDYDEILDLPIEEREEAFCDMDQNEVLCPLNIKNITDLPTEDREDAFCDMVNNEVIRPLFIQNIEYIDSSSAKIKRIYSIEDSDKIGKGFNDYYQRKFSFIEEDCKGHSYPVVHYPGDFINKWIKMFGVADRIEVDGTEQGLGILVSLLKNKEKCLLADEGYGITQLVSLLLAIDNNIPPFPSGVYGYKPKYICVEEPEIHLHPKYQSLLAEMFVEAYQKYNIHFIIETHSEYLIRKLQVMVADKENPLTSNDVSLNYVEKDEDGISHNHQIRILEDGRLSDSFGPGFFDEATDLSMRLLKMKMESK